MVMESAERGPTTAQHPGCSTAKKAKALYFNLYISSPPKRVLLFCTTTVWDGFIRLLVPVRSFSLNLLFSQSAQRTASVPAAHSRHQA